MSDPAKQNQNHNYKEHGARHTDPGMTKAIAIAPKAPAETAEQKNDEKDDQDRPK